MIKQFCSDCGHPNLYSYDKPLFCSKCGYSFGGAKASAKQTETTAVLGDEEDDGDEIGSIPDLSELDFEVARYESKAPTIGNIASEGPPDERKGDGRSSDKRGPVSPTDEKKFLQEFEKEAGSLKR